MRETTLQVLWFQSFERQNFLTGTIISLLVTQREHLFSNRLATYLEYHSILLKQYIVFLFH